MKLKQEHKTIVFIAFLILLTVVAIIFPKQENIRQKILDHEDLSSLINSPVINIKELSYINTSQLQVLKEEMPVIYGGLTSKNLYRVIIITEEGKYLVLYDQNKDSIVRTFMIKDIQLT